MIQERALELAAALRSGEYEQGKNLLCRKLDDGTMTWCCLGVACDLAVKAGVPVTVTESDEVHSPGDGHTYRKIAYNGKDGLPPGEVQHYFGFAVENGYSSTTPGLDINETTYGKRTKDLATANDRGATFTQIADYIEQYWDQL
jgi:hypothetical protein